MVNPRHPAEARSSTAHTNLRQQCSPGSRPITLTRRRVSPKVRSMIISSLRARGAIDLGVCVVDGVFDAAPPSVSRWSARCDCYRTAMVGGSAGREPSVVAELAERVGELAAQSLVLVGEFAIAAVGEFKALA